MQIERLCSLAGPLTTDVCRDRKSNENLICTAHDWNWYCACPVSTYRFLMEMRGQLILSCQCCKNSANCCNDAALVTNGALNFIIPDNDSLAPPSITIGATNSFFFVLVWLKILVQ